MTKARGISLEGFTLTAVITTPDATFVEFSKPVVDGVTEAVTFVDRGSNGLDKGDKLIKSQKMEDAENKCRHWDVGDEIINQFGKRLKQLVDGARADRGRVITKMPQSFGSGTCSIYQEACMASGTFKPSLILGMGVGESTYSRNELCPSTGGGLTVFNPTMCDQAHSQFDYTMADGQKTLKVEVRRLSDIDEEFGYTNVSCQAQQLGEYYLKGQLPAPALDVLYTDVSGAQYLHLDLNKNETPVAPAAKAEL